MKALVTFLRDVARSARHPCREHTQAIDRSLDGGLRQGEAFGLWLHLLYCRGCRRFRRQVEAIRALAKLEGRSVLSGESMPADARSRLADAIRRGDASGDQRARDDEATR